MRDTRGSSACNNVPGAFSSIADGALRTQCFAPPWSMTSPPDVVGRDKLSSDLRVMQFRATFICACNNVPGAFSSIADGAFRT